MKFASDVSRAARSIGGKTESGDERRVSVQVPQPYAAGAVELTEGEANALNQIIAENLSNNLRATIVQGKKVGEGDSATYEPFSDADAQTLVDEYLAEYEIGVRRAGSGERTVTDPVEREARKIAREKAKELVKSKGGKPSDYDLGPIVDAIFAANRDVLMREGKKIVDAASKTQNAISIEGIDLTPKAAASGSAETADAGEPVTTEA